MQPENQVPQQPGQTPQNGVPVTPANLPQPQAAQSYVPSYGNPNPAPQQPLPQPMAMPQPQPMPNSIHPEAYDFIVNPAKPHRAPLLNTSSTKDRLLMIGGIVLILIVIASIGSKLLSGGTNLLPTYTRVAIQQQELIHLTSSSVAANQQNLSTSTANDIATIQASVSSAQTQLLNYMSVNKYKINAQQLQQTFSAAIDTQLTNAASAGTYDSSLVAVLKDQITTYETSLKQAYVVTKGPKGRALLNNQFQQAELIATELDSPSD